MPKLPWNLLLTQLPTVMRAVDTLIETTQRRNAARDSAPVIDALQQRVADIEEQQRASAELLKQLTEHVEAVAVASEASSRLLRQVLAVAIVAVVLALVACVIGVVVWVRA